MDSIDPGSPAAEAGIRPGDVITAINGQTFTDLIEYRFLVGEEELVVDAVRDGEAYRAHISKEMDDPLGITFTDPVFDGIRKCKNSCVFCFIHQMPPGMRETLYVEDDDFRLSVTHGNYVTFTNVTEEDLRRAIRLHLSPIYVSVHATDPEVRVRMLRNKRAGELMPSLRRLAESGIEMHCQVVLCPGYNDGPVLDRTVEELSELAPDVLSVAVVPVGLTQFRDNLPALDPVTPELARRTIEQLHAWQERLRKRLGTRFVFPSDELYLTAGVELPPRRAYEDFPQTEDGIGLARLFLDEMAKVGRLAPKMTPEPERVLLVTGALAHPLVEALAAEVSRLTGHAVEALPVTNHFFGPRITVAGLLTARDILASVAAAGPAQRVVVPSVLLKGDRFLDDVTVAEMAERLGMPVEPVEPSPLALARHLMRARKRPARRRCPESEGTGLYVTNDRMPQ